jgi:MFS superfamily sulfate permease-like transporter
MISLIRYELGQMPSGQYAPVSQYTSAAPAQDIYIVKPEGTLFFGNAPRLAHMITTKVMMTSDGLRRPMMTSDDL